MGDCTFCGKRAGVLRKKHEVCEQTYRAGWAEMVATAANSVDSGETNVARLRRSLAAIAERSFVGIDQVDGAIAEGWRRAVGKSLQDGVLTRREEDRLREFRARFAIGETEAGRAATQLNQAVVDRLMFSAQRAALSTDEDSSALTELSALLNDAQLPPNSRRQLLIRGWEAAVEEFLEDGTLSLEEEGALLRYASHFGLEGEQVLNANGKFRDFVKGVILREIMEGKVPERIKPVGGLPFNLLKSEKLVWILSDVDYYQTKVRRIREGMSHGLSMRVARGLYYRPSRFSSETVESEETLHADTGVLGITNRHIYFHGPRRRFRIRYEKIVSFEIYSNGIGVMRDTVSAKPETFVTGDGWFIYNLVTNLAQNG